MAREWLIDRQWLDMSKLQERLGVGWNRVMRAVERLEQEGVLSEPSKDGVRIVQMDRAGNLDASRLGIQVIRNEREAARQEARDRADRQRRQHYENRLLDVMDDMAAQQADHHSAMQDLAAMQASQEPPTVEVHVASAPRGNSSDFNYWKRQLDHLHGQLVSKERFGERYEAGAIRAQIAAAEARLRAAAG